MNRRLMTAVMLAGSMGACQAMYAAPVSLHLPVHAMFGKEKMVKFNLKNNTSQVIHVKAGETEIALAPGQLVPVRLAVGEKVIAEEGTARLAAGTVVVVASSELSDVTLGIN